MKKTTTYKELTQVVSYLNSTASKDMGLDMKQDTKLTRKAVRFMKNIKNIIDDYNDSSTEIQAEFASTYPKSKENDEKGITGCLITDEKGEFVFTPANLKKRNAKLKELKEKEIEIDVVDCTDMVCINSLSPVIKDIFNGFLFNLPDEDDDEAEKSTTLKTTEDESATVS